MAKVVQSAPSTISCITSSTLLHVPVDTNKRAPANLLHYLAIYGRVGTSPYLSLLCLWSLLEAGCLYRDAKILEPVLDVAGNHLLIKDSIKLGILSLLVK